MNSVNLTQSAQREHRGHREEGGGTLRSAQGKKLPLRVGVTGADVVG